MLLPLFPHCTLPRLLACCPFLLPQLLPPAAAPAAPLLTLLFVSTVVDNLVAMKGSDEDSWKAIESEKTDEIWCAYWKWKSGFRDIYGLTVSCIDKRIYNSHFDRQRSWEICNKDYNVVITLAITPIRSYMHAYIKFVIYSILYSILYIYI